MASETELVTAEWVIPFTLTAPTSRIERTVKRIFDFFVTLSGVRDDVTPSWARIKSVDATDALTKLLIEDLTSMMYLMLVV